MKTLLAGLFAVSQISYAAVPTAVNDQLTTTINTPITFNTSQLLANDSDTDGDALSILFFDDWVNGTISFDRASNTVTFTPNHNFEGLATFTYTLSDGNDNGDYGLMAWGHVTVTVGGNNPDPNPNPNPDPNPDPNPIENTPPEAHPDQLSTTVNTPITISTSRLLSNDTDADNDPLSILFFDDWMNCTVNYDQSSQQIIITPNNNFVGEARFFYTLSDGKDQGNYELMSFATVTITVAEGTDINHPPIANDDFARVSQNTALLINESNLLANDSDSDAGDIISIISVRDAINGQVTFDSANRQIQFTPNSGFTGPASFAYDISDSMNATASARVNIDVNSSQDRQNLRTYIFGHSLINHEFGEANYQTNVPYWMSQLSKADGHQYLAAGQYGFLPQHANLPPTAQWGFVDMPIVWNSDTTAFAAVNFDSVLITAANFIQYRAASEPYEGDNPTGASPVSATLDIIDWLQAQEPGMTIYLYENWPDMASFGFPPSDTQLTNYHAYVQGAFHQWWVDYIYQLRAARPDINLQLISVGPIISDLLTNTELSNIPFNDLYEDDAPHGRATLYFLASLITYMHMHNSPTPSNFVVPETIHPLLRDNYHDISNRIWNQLLLSGAVSE